MKKMFDRKIYFPYPNYATRKQLIKYFIQKKIGKLANNFSYETFAHISEGFTAGSVIYYLILVPSMCLESFDTFANTKTE